MPAVRSVTPAVHVQALSRAARTFTGDFFFTHRRNDRLWIALGDVAGKGLPAAIVMAMIQEELEERIASCARTECDPSRTMQRLHEFLVPLLPRNRFATAVIGWLHDDGRLVLANAGHPPPFIVRADRRMEPLHSTGPVLGVLPNSSWQSTSTHLESGDALVLYTDGVSEATLGGEEIGVRGLRDRLAHSTSPDKVLAELETCDDVTLLVVRR